MGLKGLSQFLDKNFAFRKVNLQDFKALAVDGNNVCAKLYEREGTEWVHGGEYAEFSVKVEAFFRIILDAKVKPIVVVDGLREDEKIDETCKRRKDSNSKLEKWQMYGELAKNTIVLPILAFQTFMSVIDKLEIEWLVSAGEGDQLVAAISNTTPSCPVLASDSDYFMYELQNGYLPLQYFSSSKCSLYHVEDLKTQFSLHDTQIRLLIPCIHGNDFIASLAAGYQDYAQTLSQLKKYKSVEKYLAINNSFQTKYEAARKQYSITMSPAELIEKNMKDSSWLPTGQRSDTIDYHFCLIRLSKTGVNVLSNAVEKITRNSVWECSQYIRQFAYGLLRNPDVYKNDFVWEHIRQEGTSDLKKVSTLCKELQPPMNVTDILQLKTFEQEQIVLAVLKCHKMPEEFHEQLNRLPSELKLFAATIFYWYTSSDFATEHLVRALLCSRNLCDISIRIINFEHLHAFGQWQCVYLDAIALNSIAGFPFEVPSPASLFSGKSALSYAAQKPECLASEISEDLTTIFKIATCKGKRKKKHSRQMRETEAISFNPTGANRFASLSEISD